MATVNWWKYPPVPFAALLAIPLFFAGVFLVLMPCELFFLGCLVLGEEEHGGRAMEWATDFLP